MSNHAEPFRVNPVYCNGEYLGEFQSIDLKVDDSFHECQRLLPTLREVIAKLNLPAELVEPAFSNYPAAAMDERHWRSQR